jgi:hypothetical protein
MAISCGWRFGCPLVSSPNREVRRFCSVYRHLQPVHRPFTGRSTTIGGIEGQWAVWSMSLSSTLTTEEGHRAVAAEGLLTRFFRSARVWNWPEPPARNNAAGCLQWKEKRRSAATTNTASPDRYRPSPWLPDPTMRPAVGFVGCPGIRLAASGYHPPPVRRRSILLFLGVYLAVTFRLHFEKIERAAG